MAGANFAFELDGYARAGFKPAYAFPDGVMRDLRCGAAAKTVSSVLAASKPEARSTLAFAPLRLGGLTLHNKIIKEATFEAMCTDDGVPTVDLVRFHERVARGGAALTTVAYASVSPDGRSFSSQLLVGEAAMPRLRELTDAVHAAGGAAMVQLTHAGSFADRNVIGKQQMAPSIHFNPAGLNWPREMTVSEIDRVVADFANAAAIAVRCGFDAVQVHCGHGYLLSQSLSPATNRRTDEHGSGTVECRTRFALRVCQAVRKAIGPSVPIVVKMNLTDGFAGGVTLRDAISFAQVLEASKVVDLLIPSGGWISRNGFYMLRGAVPIGEMANAQRKSPVKRWALRLLGWKLVPAIPYESAYFRAEARVLKAHLRGSLPVCLLGGVDSLQVMHSALDDGFACVAIARPILHEPDFVLRMQKSESAGSAAVSGCSRCNLCIVGSAMAERPVQCTLTSSCLQW
jgi:2,4-dienoyl-CoA reductase-like NADH-dependent reductase (Old Yellow Enzyme family)